ncbi:MAG: tyrosine-protein phosphatase [Clostridia bacterium]|nr:tyrosine-protein phosphatase [Clostridia bacterium]
MKMKRISLSILSLLLALLMVFPLASCGKNTTPESTTAETTVVATEAPPKYAVRLVAPASTEIHTAAQANYLANSDPHSILTYAHATEEISKPNPIKLRWSIPESALGQIRSYTVRIWTASDLSDAKEWSVSGNALELQVYNLFVGQTYYWNVSALDGEGDVSVSETATFTTGAQAPRNLYVDSVTNVRDIGGWRTADGGRVRQGLLYRGARLNANFETTASVSEAGIKTLRDELGIKTEIDLRQTQEVNDRNESGGRTTSPLGEGVTYLAYPMDYGEVLITEPKNIERVRQIFHLLADESNYPIYFHCSIGTDRTGLIAWLVNGLLGVSETDLWRDYLFSDFGQIESDPAKARTRAKNEGVYVNQIKAKNGANLSEKTYNFLKDYFSVPEADLQSVIRILKETPTAK